MKKSHSESYKNAGVDINAGYRAVERIQQHVNRTKIEGVVGGLGGFSGLFAPPVKGMQQPLLVSATDGVGTKLKLAFIEDKHNTIGLDCVAMCVNDIICSGAKPLFFLDYIACGKTVPARIEEIVSGVADGCVQAGCALTGGETAEMPGFYKEDEYDLAGFAVGLVDKENLIDSRAVREGNVVIGLESSGLHSNGFSLVRKIFGLDGDDNAALKKISGEYIDELGETLGETLLTPTTIYVAPILALLQQLPVQAISHITGGGLYENIPRMLPQGLSVRVDEDALPKRAIFEVLAHKGNLSKEEMFSTFNMGVGMCVVVNESDVDDALHHLRRAGSSPFVLGDVVPGKEGVLL